LVQVIELIEMHQMVVRLMALVTGAGRFGYARAVIRRRFLCGIAATLTIAALYGE